MIPGNVFHVYNFNIHENEALQLGGPGQQICNKDKSRLKKTLNES